MQTTLLLVLVNLGSVAKLAVLWRSVASGLFKSHLCFCAMVVLSLSRSALGATRHPHPYLEFWQATTWPMTILQAAAAIEAFWILARHFRNIRNFGWKLVALIMAASALASTTVGVLRTRWDSPLRGPLLIDQYTGLWLVLTALLSLGFFKQFSQVPIRANAIRHLAALSVLFGMNFVGYSVGQLSRGESKFLTNLIVIGGAVLVYSWWALKINRAGEILPFPQPAPMSNQEFDDAEAAHKQSARELKRAGSEALGRTFRP